jgi:non-homologous end joining protein Ku
MLSWERLKAMAAMAASIARDIWKGIISFVLVNIPIQVFSATQKEDILHLINYVTMDIKSNTKNGVP